MSRRRNPRALFLVDTSARYRVRKYRPRVCGVCSESYHRRNRYEAWIMQKNGPQRVWQKAIVNICLRCQPEGHANRSMIMAETNIVPLRSAERRKQA